MMNVTAGVFDLFGEYNPTLSVPHTLPVRRVTIPVTDITYKTPNVFMEFKTIVDESTSHMFNATRIIQDLLPSASEVSIRIASTPHRFHAHFDCMKRRLIMLEGKKTVLRFHLPGNASEQIRTLRRGGNWTMTRWMDYLRSKRIGMQKTIISPQTTLLLRPGEYHYVEATYSPTNRRTVLLTVDYDEDERLHHRWQTLWSSTSWLDTRDPYPVLTRTRTTNRMYS